MNCVRATTPIRNSPIVFLVGLLLGWVLTAPSGGAEPRTVAPGTPPAQAVAPGAGAVVGVDEWLARARAMQQRGLMKQAVDLAGKAVEAAPRDPRPWHYRAMLRERLRQLAPAEADLSKALELAPTEPAIWFDRGVLRLRLGDYPGSVADLDRYAELRPGRAGDLWQRGIALFYAGRFEEGRRQFELHRTVNPRDVENSAWHFCCVARTSGFAAARSQLIPVEGDTRVPMREIQALFAGTLLPGDVLTAAEAAQPERRREEGRFYAQLYLALYHGAEGRPELEVRHAAEAARLGKDFGIMGEIAGLHASWVAGELRKRGR